MPPALAIRAARAADSEAAVPLIHSSGPAAFEYVFTRADGTSASDFLDGAFIDGRGEFGYRTHWVVEVDHRLVGIGAGYSGMSALNFTIAAARQIIDRYGLLGGAGVIRRGLAVERVVPPPTARNLFYIGHLGIVSDLQGRGIGQALIAHLLQQGRNAGCERAALDVSCANPRAQALYERIGFRVSAEHPSSLRNRFGAVPDHRRMEMAL